MKAAVPPVRGSRVQPIEERHAGGSAAESQLPDLRALPPYEVQLAGPDENPFQGGTMLRFAMATLNAGTYALEILGTPKDTQSNTASQCTAWMNGLCTGYEPVGDVYFHQEHMHWHFRDYARYELRALVGHKPNWRPNGVVADGGKVSFCFADTEGEDGAEPVYVKRYNDTCNPVIQGISPGWIDVYAWYTPGQLVDVTSVPDGDYALAVTANAAQKLRETDYSNNRAYRLVRLSTAVNGQRSVTVLDPS
jgi:hypothetical protein